MSIAWQQDAIEDAASYEVCADDLCVVPATRYATADGWVVGGISERGKVVVLLRLRDSEGHVLRTFAGEAENRAKCRVQIQMRVNGAVLVQES